jgi:hypothetical protein
MSYLNVILLIEETKYHGNSKLSSNNFSETQFDIFEC